MRGVLWCAIALPLCAQPPAVFEALTIEYRIASDQLIETRSGILRLDSATLAPSLRLIVLPRLNSRGEAVLKEAVILGRETSTAVSPAMQAQRSTFSWTIDEAQAEDRIRFVTEQPVDLTSKIGGEWWYANSTTIPLPVESGTVRLVLSNGFAGSVHAIDPANSGTGHEWSLAGSKATTTAARFTVSSFASWSEFSAWIQAQCPVTRDVGNRAFGTPMQTAATLAGLLTVTATNQLPCRAPDAVLASGVASPLEAASTFASALASRGLAAERLFISPRETPVAVDPTIFGTAFVRVGEQWFDASHLDRGDGVRLTTGMESALPLRDAAADWIAPLVAHPALRLQASRIDAHVDAEVLSNGLLGGTVSVVLEGAAEEQQTFAPFLASRRIGATPDSTKTPERLARLIVMREEGFIQPFERNKQTVLNAVPLASEPVRLSEGGLYLGGPGIYRERIELAPSDSRRVNADVDLNIDHPYARYRSSAAVENGRLAITRELEIRSAYVTAADANLARGFIGQVREDQQRIFNLQRTGNIDWKPWVDSISPYQLNDVAYKAYLPNGEFEAALMLLDRATEINPKDAYAWGLKATIHALLGREREALRDRTQQAEIDAKNTSVQQSLTFMQMTLDPQRAIETARAQLAANPKDAAALAYLQGGLVTLKRWAEAEEIATRVLELRAPGTAQSLLRLSIATYQACQGKLENPAEAFDEALRTIRAPTMLTLIVTTLNECERHADVANKYCGEFLGLMDPFIPATTSDMLSLVAFPQSFASGLYQCGLVHIRLGMVDSGLDRVRASARISTTPSTHQPAKALWRANQREEAEALWIEAVQIYPELLDQVPEEIRDHVRSASTGVVFPGWIPMPSVAAQVERTVDPADEMFFAVRADERGEVTRVFDLNVVQAPRTAAALRGMKLPNVAFDGRAIPSVQFVMVRRFGEQAEVFRSFATPVIRMLQIMRADLFRPPQATRPQ